MTKTLGSFELPLYYSQQHRDWAVYGRPYHQTVWSGNKVNMHLLGICDVQKSVSLVCAFCWMGATVG